MRAVSLILVIIVSALAAGCPSVPAAQAALEGTWAITLSEPGDWTGWDLEATFNSAGRLTELSGVDATGITITQQISNSTTTLDGDGLTVEIPQLGVTTVFAGTISEDGNTVTGALADEIAFGSFGASLPRGDLTLERITE